ncbi:hypothetical protein NPIL_512321 [Nephila pilipes]|uniref:Uncharacterized protein n=1 Tax=Nephila pilipes TaxID=299642 RepID=A0A8X6QMH8_NEPPI|nr:hypothetical protein NPIL_512321 [Nephila pilipes]
MSKADRIRKAVLFMATPSSSCSKRTVQLTLQSCSPAEGPAQLMTWKRQAKPIDLAGEDRWPLKIKGPSPSCSW